MNHDRRKVPPAHGNYADLLSYQKAEIVYDLTYRFCERFLKKGDRTIDQMVQAGLRQTEHHRGEQGVRDLEGDGDQAH